MIVAISEAFLVSLNHKVAIPEKKAGRMEILSNEIRMEC